MSIKLLNIAMKTSVDCLVIFGSLTDVPSGLTLSLSYVFRPVCVGQHAVLAGAGRISQRTHYTA